MSRSISDFFSKNRFLILFISFILLFALEPFLDKAVTIDTLIDVLVTVILISAVYAISQKRRTQVIALVLGIPFFVGHWGVHVLDSVPLKLIGVLSGVLFFGYVSAIIVRHLFTEQKVTPDLVLGSLCGYFLVGFMWAFAYAAIEIVSPGSLHLPQEGYRDLSNFFYYSFVTLTTLGYGDILPLTSPARNFAILEAVIGQIYLTVLVARLVGIHISQSMRKEQ
jgi:hypothetical protein